LSRRPGAGRFAAIAAGVAAAVLLLAACGRGGPVGSEPPDAPPPDGITESFAAFRAEMEGRGGGQTALEEGGCRYALEDGVLAVTGPDGAEIWRSDPAWWVAGVALGDVDGDGGTDFCFTVWKSYRFGEAKPDRLENDDESVRCHLFLYTVKGGAARAVWCSSDLPRPILSFALDPGGEVTPVSSGMLLRTVEGFYAGASAPPEEAGAEAFVYAWEGWGFVPTG
jgi:predicted small lipoprotein YifL